LVFHAGSIGEDGRFLIQMLRKNQVDSQFIRVTDVATGHASIQVTDNGENAIVIYGGANQTVDEKFADEILSNFQAGDLIILQNEINFLPELMHKAKARDLKILFSASPFLPSVLEYPLHLVDWLVVNELEAEHLSGKTGTENIQAALAAEYPEAHIIMTQGSKGVSYIHQDKRLFVPAMKVRALDTTAAGDTFIGYFVANYFSEKKSLEESLKIACAAAAVCVTRSGAAESIPFVKELSVA